MNDPEESFYTPWFTPGSAEMTVFDDIETQSRSDQEFCLSCAIIWSIILTVTAAIWLLIWGWIH